MTTPYDRLVADLRAAAQPARPAAPELASYLEKVRLHAYKVTDQDVDELKRAVLRKLNAGANTERHADISRQSRLPKV